MISQDAANETMSAPARKVYIREPFSAISHLVGAGLGIAGMVVLLVKCFGHPWHTVSYALYGASLILLYLASGLYHALPVSGKALDWFKRIDHSAILILIAGSFMPICLVLLRGALGWSLFGVAWGIALPGAIVILLVPKTPHWVRLVLYIGLGWVASASLPTIRATMPPVAMTWLIAGGLSYTIGAAVYATQRPRLWPGIFGAHDLWHIFVLAGSVFHYMLMYMMLPK